MKYLKEFQNHSQYTAYIASEGKILPNVSTCIQEDDVHYTQLTCEVRTIYELVGNPSYPSEIEGSETSFEMSFNYKRTDIDNRCRKKISYGSDSVTINVGYNPGATRVIENTYNYKGLAIPYTVTQTTLDAKVTAKFNVESAGTQRQILSSTTSIYSIEVDGVVQPSVTSAYTFDTAGEHTVVYRLNSPSIGTSAFTRCGFSDVVIGSGVTSIGDYAFYVCWGKFTSCIIGDNVKSIGSRSFGSCGLLTSIDIPSGVTSIGEQAFNACSAVTSITVDSSNTTYDSRNNCNAIIETSTNTLIRGCRNTVIPDSVTAIGNYAFGDCSGLTSAVISDNATSIGDSAFQGCKTLTSCTIGSGVTSIGEDAFYDTGLKSIVIPDGVTKIKNGTFSNCRSLTSCTIGSGVTSIVGTVFQSCALKNITIPDNVKTINGNVFFFFFSLTAATIGSGVTSISSTAFNRCGNLTGITVNANNPVYDSRDNCNAIIETATNTLVVGCKGTVIPNTVTAIGNKAFYWSVGLTRIVIPNSVVTIDVSAFSNCWSLTSVTIPNSVTTINDSAFSSCYDLSSITLPSSLTTLGRSVFFGGNITTITSLATTAPTIVSGTFYGSENDGTLYVPIGSTGYDVWMSSDNYYLGKYNWKKVEQ